MTRRFFSDAAKRRRTSLYALSLPRHCRTRVEAGTSFAVKLIKLRQERGWTQAELAQRAGLKQSAIARIEGGDSVPRLDTAMRIAKALGMKLDFVKPGRE